MKVFSLTSISAVLAASGFAHGALVSYEAVLSGPAESPPNASPGTGIAMVDIDTTAHTVRYRAAFSGLLGTTTVAHVHAATPAPFAGTAGVATQTPSFPAWPAGVTSGSYDMTFDTTLGTTWNPAFVTANGGTPLTAEAAFASALAGGRAYFNVHSSLFGGGEIRGFLALVPTPSSLGVLALGSLFACRRRRR
ncbi:MAG: CHRD domain-containing protein [Phycisphaerales bacterium]|nr:CHRD domain-containing protein [Phycisphaerales bacterium]